MFVVINGDDFAYRLLEFVIETRKLMMNGINPLTALDTFQDTAQTYNDCGGYTRHFAGNESSLGARA